MINRFQSFAEYKACAPDMFETAYARNDVQAMQDLVRDAKPFRNQASLAELLPKGRFDTVLAETCSHADIDMFFTLIGHDTKKVDFQDLEYFANVITGILRDKNTRSWCAVHALRIVSRELLDREIGGKSDINYAFQAIAQKRGRPSPWDAAENLDKYLDWIQRKNAHMKKIGDKRMMKKPSDRRVVPLG